MEGVALSPPGCWLFLLGYWIFHVGYWIFSPLPVPLGHWIFSRRAGSRECGTDIGHSLLSLIDMGLARLRRIDLCVNRVLSDMSDSAERYIGLA